MTSSAIRAGLHDPLASRTARLERGNIRTCDKIRVQGQTDHAARRPGSEITSARPIAPITASPVNAYS